MLDELSEPFRLESEEHGPKIHEKVSNVFLQLFPARRPKCQNVKSNNRSSVPDDQSPAAVCTDPCDLLVLADVPPDPVVAPGGPPPGPGPLGSVFSSPPAADTTDGDDVEEKAEGS